MSRATTDRFPIVAPLLAVATLSLIAGCSTPAPRPDPGATSAAPSHAAGPLPAVPSIPAAALEPRLATSTAPLLLDVRTPAEYAAGHLPGARLIPHDQLPQRLAELGANKDQEVLVYCRSGRRAAQAIDTLTRAGFTHVGHLQGDYQRWSAEGRRTSTAEAAIPPPAAPRQP